MARSDALHAPARPPAALAKAIGWMLASCIGFAILWGLIRLASHQFHPFVIVFWRNMMGVLVQLPFALYHGLQTLRTPRFLTHIRRAGSGLIAALANFYAVAHAPLATVNAIGYASPLFTTIAATLLLGEKIRRRRVAALIIGFIGVLVVVRPGHVPLTMGIMAAVIGAVAVSFSIIAIKQLSFSEPAQRIVFYSFLLMAPPSLLFALPYWRWPTDLSGWALLIGVGVMASLAQSAMVRAFALADATAVMPFDFLRFGLIVLIGAFMFHERIDMYTLGGGAIILASTIYLAHRERIHANAQKLASSTPDA